MYHAECMIDGELYWRNTPDGRWMKYSTTQLSEKILELQEENKRLWAMIPADKDHIGWQY